MANIKSTSAHSDSSTPPAVVTNADIVIVGGGMVGATLAALLAHLRDDWRIVLVEAFNLPVEGAPPFQPSYDDRSTALAYGSVQLLKQIGIWDSLAQYATPIRQVHVSDRGHFGGSVIDADDLQLDAVGQVVANAHLGRTLFHHISQCDSISILAPASVEQVKPLAQGVQLTINSGSETSKIQSKLAVIADGAESSLRASLGIDVDIETYRQSAVIANVTLEQSHNNIAYERFTDYGPMALLPLDGQGGCQSALVWTQPEEQVEAIMTLSDQAFLDELQLRFGFRLGHFTRVGKRDCYPLQLMVAKEQVRSSIVVMGNAAHFLHPVAGQGFNLAIRDCAALAAELNRAQQHNEVIGSLEVLQRYEQQQKNDQLATIQFSDKLTRLFSTTQLPAAALRAFGLFGLETLPGAKQLFASQTMGRSGKRSIPISE
jgi:2-octaprenylphenol hydroxylase